MLRLMDIRKTYAIGPIAVEVLRGIGLDVEQGDLVSIMGPSGCGKSTLMNIIGLLDQPTSGSYLLEGREVSSMGDNQLSAIRNARIGFVFQSFHLLPRLTALENVGLPLVYRGLRDKEVKRRAREVLDKVGMHDRASSPAERTLRRANSSGWPSPVRWSGRQPWCSPTNLPAPWTRASGRRSCRCSSA